MASPYIMQNRLMLNLFASQLAQVREQGVLLFVDVNETLLRTGALNRDDAIADTHALFDFRANLVEIAKHTSVSVILISGNTFEYLRRVEEPLGLSTVDNLKLGFVSENGLIGRMGNLCDDWFFKFPARIQDELDSLKLKLPSTGPDAVFLQGNESRLTIKPVQRTLQPDSLEIVLCELSINRDRKQSWGHYQSDDIDVFSSPFYIDLDPRKIIVEEGEVEFLGKKTATRKIFDATKAFPIGFGDSQSDAPMMDCIVAHGGIAIQVGNSRGRWSYENAIITESTFGDGVNEVLQAFLRQLDC